MHRSKNQNLNANIKYIYKVIQEHDSHLYLYFFDNFAASD